MTGRATALVPMPYAGGGTSETWLNLARVAILLALIPALRFGIIRVTGHAAGEIMALLGGYATVLALGQWWLPPLRKTDLVVAADIVVITLVVRLSGNLSSPFIYFYYLAVLEAATRFNFRQAIAASLAMAGVLSLLWALSGRLPMVETAGFRRNAFIAGGFLLALLAGALAQEFRARRGQPQAAARADVPPTDMAAPLEAQVQELQFFNELAAGLSGELRVKGVLTVLLGGVLDATGLSKGAAYLVGEDGVPQFAASLGVDVEDSDREPAGLSFPALPAEAAGGEVLAQRPTGEDGLPSAPVAYVPLVRAGSLRAWLCAMGPVPESFPEAVLRRVQGIAARGVAPLEAARLHEEVQRMTRINPARSLYPWNQLQRLVAEEIRRCTELVLVFSLVEIQLAEYGRTSWAGDRDGDLALRRVVKLLQTSLRRVDVISHDGAGRFILLLPRVAKAQAVEMLRRVIPKLEEDALAARLLEVKQLAVTVGLVTFPEDGNTPAALFEKLKELVADSHPASNRGRVPGS